MNGHRRRYCMRAGVLSALVVTLSACTVGPDYHVPHADVPASWQQDPGWLPAQPGHADLALDWWQAYGDAVLNDLQNQALAQNQTLALASAHYDQARATLAGVSAQRLPEVDVAAGASRLRVSQNRPVTNYATPSHSTVQNNVQIGPSITYDTDLFGRLRRQEEGATASAEASADDLANARLVLTANLATTYFSLRETDAELDILNRSVVFQQKALDYVQARHDLGAVSGLDVAEQQSQLDSTRVQAQLLLRQRAQYEHAIAALVGVPAPQFHVVALSAAAPELQRTRLPEIDAGLPSGLLQRRPDIASAERAMASANAQIGVARAAFFPNITLAPGIGWESTAFASLLTAPSLMWTVGGALSQVIFDGGRRSANVAYARAGYQAAQANYRQTVLNAFQQVQDSISGLAVLQGAADESQHATADAQRLLSLANDRYTGGLVAYLDVINAQQMLLTAQRQQTQLRGQQLLLSVTLIQALGGGWQNAGPEKKTVSDAAAMPWGGRNEIADRRRRA